MDDGGEGEDVQVKIKLWKLGIKCVWKSEGERSGGSHTQQNYNCT